MSTLPSKDAGKGIVFACENYSDITPINVGYGMDITIADLAYTIKQVIGYKGEVIFDTTKPEGVMRKLMDSTIINNMEWSPAYDVHTGIQRAHEDFLSAYDVKN